MKSVKSKRVLNKMALAAGASVTDERGAKFNTAKKVAAPRKRLEKNQETPPPKPTGPDPGSRLVAEKIEAGNKGIVMMLAELKEQMSEIQMQAYEPITDWDFEFIRDDRGYTTNLLAHGSVAPKVIN